MCRDIRWHTQALDALINALVGRYADAPSVWCLQIPVAVQRTTFRDDVLLQVDEGIGQIPQTARIHVVEHFDLGVMHRVNGHTLCRERTPNCFEEYVPPLHLPPIGTAGV